jgi:hypothetical protein
MAQEQHSNILVSTTTTVSTLAGTGFAKWTSAVSAMMVSITSSSTLPMEVERAGAIVQHYSSNRLKVSPLPIAKTAYNLVQTCRGVGLDGTCVCWMHQRRTSPCEHSMYIAACAPTGY